MSVDQTAALNDQRILVLGLFLEAHALLVDRLDEELADVAGLSMQWFEVLIRLARTPDSVLKVSDLAHSLALSTGGTTRLIDRLEAAGLLERRRDTVDRRVVWVTLTVDGWEMLRAALPVHLDGVERLLVTPVGERNLPYLERVMRSIRDRADADV